MSAQVTGQTPEDLTSISEKPQANQMIEYNNYLIFRHIVKNDYICNLRINA